MQTSTTKANATDLTKWDEIKLIADTYMKTWAIFVAWFSWFFGINVAAMAYVAVSDKPIRPELIFPLCAFMALCVVFGSTAAVLISMYSHNCKKRVKTISLRYKYDIDTNAVLASPALNIAGWVILASLIWTLLAWVVIALWHAEILRFG
ncbi:hypothetical protein [Methylobacterium sp. ARG-1]|uniref:hypothetical protein n=1 Tax=Methylobacterium sp. ARG-1 TaxID=1692501 RepID=UPI0011876929|nr:hypothetical protein [Methylobacterium sp. ARG-1]